VKLTHHFPLPLPCRSTATVEHLRRRALLFTDEPPPAIPHPTQAHHQVRLEPLVLPGPLALATGDPPSLESGRSNPLPTIDLGQGLDYLDLNLLTVLSAKVQILFNLNFENSEEIVKK